MTNSLIPERPLLVSPSLAATIGLEEATLLHVLNEFVCLRDTIYENGFEWITIDNETLTLAMPFWSLADIQRISKSLRDTGIILIGSAPLSNSFILKFAFNEPVEQSQPRHYNQSTQTLNNTSNAEQHYNAPTTKHFSNESSSSLPKPTQTDANQLGVSQEKSNQAIVNQPIYSRTSGHQDTYYPSASVQKSPKARAAAQRKSASPDQIKDNISSKQDYADANYSRSASYIAPGWRPTDDILRQLAMQGISKTFAITQIPEFVTYWSERHEAHFSWGSKFVSRVLHQWREHQVEVANDQKNNSISSEWYPSEDAIEILQRVDITPSFIEDAVPEFVLYWKERGEPSKTWNSKFISHVKLQWARFTSALEHDTQPTQIAQSWSPSNDVYDVLKLANIDRTFAERLVSEFVIFWRDTNEIARSWNTKFLQHTKFHWARQHNLATNQLTDPIGNYNAQKQRSTGSNNQKSSTFERLTDRSWAEGLNN